MVQTHVCCIFDAINCNTSGVLQGHNRIRKYTTQVEGQRKEAPQPVVIEGEEEWEVEKILNKRKV